MAKKAAAPKNLTTTILERSNISGLTWVADAGCSGLRARLSMNRGNRKVGFYFRYRDRTTGDRKIMKVGDYPALSIADARNKVNTELRPIADTGTDVKAESRRMERSEATGASSTIADLIPQYIEYCELQGTAEGTIKSYKRYLRPLQFWHGKEHPSELTRIGAHTIFLKVEKKGGLTEEGKQTGKGGSRAAGLTHSASRAFYNWLLDDEVVQANPWMNQKKMKSGVAGTSAEDFFLDDDAIRQAMTDLEGRHAVVFRLLLATGLRPMEVCAGKWSEIKDGVWTIPGGKSGRMKWRDGGDHKVYLSSYAQELLSDWSRTQKGRPRYIFPTEGEIHQHLNSDTLRWGFPPKICRSTAATILQTAKHPDTGAVGCPDDVSDRMQHHAYLSKVGKSYKKANFEHDTKVWWEVLGEHLRKLEPDFEAPDNVVPLRKGA